MTMINWKQWKYRQDTSAAAAIATTTTYMYTLDNITVPDHVKNKR